MKRKMTDFQRSDLVWHIPEADREKRIKDGLLAGCIGWVEYDFDVPRTGWYELLFKTPSGWVHDIRLDGTRLHYGPFNDSPVEKDAFKLQNVWVTTGKPHTLRVQMLHWPGFFSSEVQLREAPADPSGVGCAKVKGTNILRRGDKLQLLVTAGGNGQAVSYDIGLLREEADEALSLTSVAFPASAEPVTKTVSIPCPEEGVFKVQVSSGGKALRMGDLRGGQVVVVDTKSTSTPPEALKRTQVVDIDCTQERTTGFWENAGNTRVINAPFGKYRESSGAAPNTYWALDGFAYAFELPEAWVPYMLEVDYPDDDRRTMGFWVNGAVEGVHPNQITSFPLTGGVECGDHYRLTNRMQTYRAIFYPGRAKDLRIAIINFNKGMRAAASRIRIYRFDGPLTAGTGKKATEVATTSANGRRMGYYFEEPGRWLRHFGAKADDLPNHFTTLMRWAEMARYTGANLLWPTVLIYQNPRYPSDLLEGYFCSPMDEPRLTALICEKFGLQYVPEIHLSGSGWFDSHTMKSGKPEGNEYLTYSRLGTVGEGSNAPRYNCLHPYVQKVYLDVLGELADRLADCPAFTGLSSRLMNWVWQSWNAIPSLNWGYEDWTITQFEKETGVKVPGAPNDPERFARRFEFLTSSAMKEKWLSWRCSKVLDLHRRIRDRIRKAKPTAKLYFTYWGGGMDYPFGSLGQTETEKLRETGIDPALYQKEPGIALIPAASYGRRQSTPVADQAGHDALFDDDYKSLGMMGERGCGLYSTYFEVNENLDWKVFGTDQSHTNFDACIPSARHELEIYAAQLADMDCATFINGGNGYIWGEPLYLREFLAEYKALPDLPFTPLPQGRDPVAVWYRQCPDAFYFYAVNRERYSVTATLRLKGAKSLSSASTGAAVALKGDALALQLEPYQLRSFRATATGKSSVVLTGCNVQVPEAEKALVKEQLDFCQKLGEDLAARRARETMTQREVDRYLALLREAQEAFERGHYWRARVNLERTPMIATYEKCFRYPPKLHHRKFPRSPLNAMKAPTIRERLTSAGETEIVPSESFDPLWTGESVLVSKEGAMEIGVSQELPNRRRLSVGVVSEKPGKVEVSLDGKAVSSFVYATARRPQEESLSTVPLTMGDHTLSFSKDGSLGVYDLALAPLHRPLTSNLWQSIGPFTSKRVNTHYVGLGLAKAFPPEQEIRLDARYTNDEGKSLSWLPFQQAEDGVNFLTRNGVFNNDICYAVTFLYSPENRLAEIFLGVDWWGRAWLNGKELIAERDRSAKEKQGAEFMGKVPCRAVAQLTKGSNQLLVKVHAGSAGSWFACSISDPGDLRISATP